MEPPGDPGTLGELQGPDSRIPFPRDKRRDGSIASTIILASGRSFPGPEVGKENDSCSRKSQSVAGEEISLQRAPFSGEASGEYGGGGGIGGDNAKPSSL